MFKKNNKKTSKERLDEKVAETPKVVFKYEVLLKMNQIVNTCTAEVGWLGSVQKNGDRYLVDDVYLLKQKVTGTTTELDEEDMHDFFNDLILKDPEKYNSMRLWGHSHVQMPVFASAQDDETFKEYYQECPYFIRLIANQKEEMKVDIAVKEDGYIYKDIPWYVEYPANIVAAMQRYENALKEVEEAEKYVADIKESLESSFKDTIDKEIKDKVIEEKKLTYYEKNNKVSPYSWRDDEMDDYANWYDYYGYQGEGKYHDPQEEMMAKCDVGKKIWYDGKKQCLTDVFDSYEIIELHETCKNWKDIKAMLEGDPRTITYAKRDWITLYDSVKSTCKEFERRTA